MADKLVNVIVDTREQNPWTFAGQPWIKTRRATLETGDYSVEGMERRVSIERKSLDDFIGTVMKERNRFYEELRRLQSFDILRCVIIETGIRDIYDHKYESKVAPDSIFGFISEMCVSQHVPIYLGESRPGAQVLAAWLLRAASEYGAKIGKSPI